MPETQPEIASPGSLLADDMYPPVETPVEPAPEPAPPPQADAEPPDPVAAEEPETPSEPEPEPQADDSEGVEVKTVEELAEHFELDPEWLQNLTISQKVNGQDIDVSLADALSTHRQVTAADTYLAEAKEKAKTMRDEASQHKEQFAGAVATFAAMIQNLETEIESDASSINWQELRSQDPAEYTARKEDLRERRDKMAAMRSEAVENYNKAVALIDQQQQQTMVQNLPQQHEQFAERIPEWGDEKVAKKERDEVVKYLMADGFTQEDIQFASFNGKVLAMAVKAKRYDDSKGKSDAARKKVVKIPKVLKPGSHEAPSTPTAASDDPVDLLYGPG